MTSSNYPSNLLSNTELVQRIAEKETWGNAGWSAWETWREEFVKRGIADVYLIPGGKGEFEDVAISVSWHPGGQFVRIDRTSPTPILQAVADLSRKLPSA